MKREFFNEYNITLGIYNVQSQERGKYLWLAAAIANYFTAAKREKVAVVELSGKNALEELAGHFGQSIKKGKYFELFGVQYYPYYNERVLSEIMGENYNHIIFDGVQIFGNRNVDLLSYRKRILAGSLKPWEEVAYKACLTGLSEKGQLGDYVFLAEYFEHKEVGHIEKEKGISLIQLPTALNPFRIKRTEFQFFETFL